MSIEKKYEDICEMIRGSSPNWTHQEILDRCSQQVDALVFIENNPLECVCMGKWKKMQSYKMRNQV
jgi:hypothetical protein